METIQYLWKKGYLPQTLVEDVFEKKRGYKTLWPVQQKAIEEGIFDEKSIVISAPTASGKTFIGELAAIKNALDGKTTLYLVPLKALADEKFALFKEDYGDWFTSCMFTADSTPSEAMVRNSKLIIGTYEKIDLLIRNKAPWLGEIKTLVVDEIQVIDDLERGPTLELIITRLKKENPNLQIIGISATLHERSVKEMARWLKAKAIIDKWRPVELTEGKYSLNCEKLVFSDGTIVQRLPDNIKGLIDALGNKQKVLGLIDHQTIKAKIAADLTKKYVEENRKVLVFAPTRKLAEEFASNFGKFLNSNDELKALALKAIQIGAEPGRTTKKLVKCIEMGTAFHHAGLRAEHRVLIQHEFEKGPLKVICATPTLSMGVNFPADVVIFIDHVRGRYPGRGELGIIEYQNMVGRAGRPGFHSEEASYKGYSILLALNKSEEDRIDKYLDSQPQPVFSKLNVSPTLGKIVISLISTEKIKTCEELVSFLGDTLFGTVFGDRTAVGKNIDEIISKVLIPCGLVENKNGVLEPTEMGNAIARVGLEPLSAPMIKAGLEYFKVKEKTSPLEILHLITGTFDYEKFSPIFFVPQTLKNEYLKAFTKDRESFLPFITSKLEKIRGVFILNDWINETLKIEETHHIAPGDTKKLTDVASWILKSIAVIAENLGLINFVQEMNKIVKRIKYGIREDLLALFPVDLKTIGRRQARNLYEGGFQTWEDILQAPLKTLCTNGRITRQVARALKMELVEKLEIDPLEKIKWRHIVKADKLGQNVELIKGLYESTDDEFSHWVESAFQTLLGPDFVGRFPQNGNPDVWIKEGNRYFATIECYAPTKRESIDLSKILEAKKGARYSPDNMCICTNADRVPEENLPTAKANAITIFHVTGLTELLLSKWESKINLEFIGKLFETVGVVINAAFIRKLIKSQLR